MKAIPTISVGIAAYNEEANIQQLLVSLLDQKIVSAKLEKIIIVSDGSDDSTCALARSVQDDRISLIEKKEREGTDAARNKISSLAKSDILVMLDADILPVNDEMLESIAQAFIKDPAIGLLAGDILPLPPRNFFERILNDSHALKSRMFNRIKRGNNVYLCRGPVRAFSRDFYSNIIWPKDVPEDAYSYLECVRQGRKFIFEPGAAAYFRSPSTISDHKKQSARFEKGKEKIKEYFSEEVVTREYTISPRIALISLSHGLLLHPVTLPLYVIVNVYIHYFTKPADFSSVWHIAGSSKNLS